MEDCSATIRPWQWNRPYNFCPVPTIFCHREKALARRKIYFLSANGFPPGNAAGSSAAPASRQPGGAGTRTAPLDTGATAACARRGGGGLRPLRAAIGFGLAQLVSSHRRLHFLRPGVNAAAQTAHILQTVTHEIRRRVETVLASVINHDNGIGI